MNDFLFRKMFRSLKTVRTSQGLLVSFFVSLYLSHTSGYGNLSLWRCIQKRLLSERSLSGFSRNTAQVCSTGSASEGRNASNVNVTLRERASTWAYNTPPLWPLSDMILGVVQKIVARDPGNVSKTAPRKFPMLWIGII